MRRESHAFSICPVSPAGRRSRGAGGLRIIDQLARREAGQHDPADHQVPSQSATTGPSNYAKAKGFFEAEGQDVTVQPIQGGAVEAAL